MASGEVASEVVMAAGEAVEVAGEVVGHLAVEGLVCFEWRRMAKQRGVVRRINLVLSEGNHRTTVLKD